MDRYSGAFETGPGRGRMVTKVRCCRTSATVPPRDRPLSRIFAPSRAPRRVPPIASQLAHTAGSVTHDDDGRTRGPRVRPTCRALPAATSPADCPEVSTVRNAAHGPAVNRSVSWPPGSCEPLDRRRRFWSNRRNGLRGRSAEGRDANEQRLRRSEHHGASRLPPRLTSPQAAPPVSFPLEDFI